MTDLNVLPPVKPVHPERYRVGGTRRNHIFCVHDTEGGEGIDSAEGISNFVAQPAIRDAQGRIVNAASYQAVGDVDSIRLLVAPADTAFHCGGLNSSYGYCLTGKAAQSRDEWSDALSGPSVERGGRFAGQHFLHLGSGEQAFRWLTNDELASKVVAGFTTHNQIRIVFGGTTHSDPGVNFPYDMFMDFALDEYRLLVAPDPTPPPPEDDVQLTRYQCTDCDAAFIGYGDPSAYDVALQVEWCTAEVDNAFGPWIKKRKDAEAWQFRYVTFIGDVEALSAADTRRDWTAADFRLVVPAA